MYQSPCFIKFYEENEKRNIRMNFIEIRVDMNMYECFHVSKCANCDINSTLMTLKLESYIKTQDSNFLHELSWKE